MKKLTFILSAAAMLFSISAMAVSPEDIVKSIDRYDKLYNMEAPAPIGLTNIDALAAKAKEAREHCLDIALRANMIYVFTGGEIPEGYVYVGPDPTIEDCEMLLRRIEAQTKLVGDATQLAANAAGDLKGIKPLQIGKANKSINTSKDIFAVVAEETAHQLDLIKTSMANLGK